MPEVVFWKSAEVKAGRIDQTKFPWNPSYQAEKSRLRKAHWHSDNFFQRNCLTSNFKHLRPLVGIELRVTKSLRFLPLRLCTGSCCLSSSNVVNITPFSPCTHILLHPSRKWNLCLPFPSNQTWPCDAPWLTKHGTCGVVPVLGLAFQRMASSAFSLEGRQKPSGKAN